MGAGRREPPAVNAGERWWTAPVRPLASRALSVNWAATAASPAKTRPVPPMAVPSAREPAPGRPEGGQAARDQHGECGVGGQGRQQGRGQRRPAADHGGGERLLTARLLLFRGCAGSRSAGSSSRRRPRGRRPSRQAIRPPRESSKSGPNRVRVEPLPFIVAGQPARRRGCRRRVEGRPMVAPTSPRDSTQAGIMTRSRRRARRSRAPVPARWRDASGGRGREPGVG